MFELEAKKSLGQNFLKNTTLIEKMVVAGNIEKGDIILEIGPGTGVMTEIILKKADLAGAKVVCIEKDQRAIPILEAKFKRFLDKGTLNIIEGDFLEMDIGKIFKNPYKVIANIPYYITGAIIRRVLEDKIKPKMAIFLVQKEVAERIVRRDGNKNRQKSNILAESISAYGKAEYLFTVAKGNFVPAPKVDSAAILISEISNARFKKSGVSERRFFEVMKAGFSHKRKKVISNLKEYFGKDQLENIFLSEEINLDARAEEISTETWFAIAKKLK